MWKVAGRVLALVFLAGSVSGCGSRSTPADPTPDAVVVHLPTGTQVATAPANTQATKKTVEPTTRKKPVANEAAHPPVAPANEKKNREPLGNPQGLVKAEGPSSAPDRAGKLVIELLRPSEEMFTPRWDTKVLPAGPRSLERPDLPLPPFVGQVVRVRPQAPAHPPVPRALPEEMPLVRVPADRRLPAPIELAAGPLVRVAGPDIQQPPALPILALPHSDQTGPSDPTLPASLEAALGEMNPARTGPVPFDRPAIPDPFENRRAIRLRTPPPEPLPPPAELPRTPPKNLP